MRVLLVKLVTVIGCALLFAAPALAEPLPLKTVVTPSSVIVNGGKPVTFAIHGYIEFQSLSQASVYIDSQELRWK